MKLEKFKVAVVGNSQPSLHLVNRCRPQITSLSQMLAKNGAIMLTGACTGLPHFAAEAAFAAGGEVIGYSPASSSRGHVGKWGPPLDPYRKVKFCGKGLSHREVELIRAAHCLVVLDGNLGTLTEVLMAIKEGRPVIVLKDVGPFAAKLSRLMRMFRIYPLAPRVVYVETRRAASILAQYAATQKG